MTFSTSIVYTIKKNRRPETEKPRQSRYAKGCQAKTPDIRKRPHRKRPLFSSAAVSGGLLPGGGTQVQRGAAPALRISRKKGSFFKTACLRFCKRRVLFRTQVRSMGVKIPLQSTEYTRLCRRVTPKVTGLPSLLPLNMQRIIKSWIKIRVPVLPMSVFW